MNITIFNKALFLLIVLAVSCTSDFNEINENPNQLTVGKIQAIGMFEPILYDGANKWAEYTWYWNNELMQYTVFSGGTTREEHRYFISEVNFQAQWNFYAGYANNAVHMYELADEEGNATLKAIALTWKVYYLSNLTDMFGDIPYSEAFQGRTNGNTTPKFDTQKEVYIQMFTDLEIANQLYSQNYVFRNSELDKMYGGDVAKWRKFNNSLYLRLLMRVSGRTEMNAGLKIKSILENQDQYPIFSSNADNATVKFSGTFPYVNFFSSMTENNFTRSGRHLAEQIIKMTVFNSGMELKTDPRLSIFGKTNNTAQTWKGAISGGTIEQTTNSNTGASLLNTEVFCRTAAPYSFMDYSEIQFIFAEAALKGMISGGTTLAKSYYEAAIQASIEKWNGLGSFSKIPVDITNQDIADFLEMPQVAFNSGDNIEIQKQRIADQKYIALFWVGLEAWHEYRRTGFPKLTIGEGTLNDHILPTRFSYPNVTIAANSENANKAIANMGGTNDMKTPVWWSKQAIDGN